MRECDEKWNNMKYKWNNIVNLRLRFLNLLLKNEIIDFLKIIFRIVYYIFKNIYDDIWFYRIYDVF